MVFILFVLFPVTASLIFCGIREIVEFFDVDN